jgi:hypothetical protein
VDPLALLRGSLLPSSDDEVPAHLSLEGGQGGFIDRWLPRRPLPFVAAAIALPLVVWVVALLLAPDRGRFLQSRDWLAQPLYFTVHLVVLRQFVAIYTRHFAAGLEQLVPAATADATPRIDRLLGARGFLIALVIAVPFVYMDIVHVSGREFLSGGDAQGSIDHPAASDRLLLLLWTLQWVINGYTWVLLVGFATLTIRTIERHEFRASLEVVLHERQYRPFLLMSAQGATIMVGYTVATAAYVFLARGQPQDWIRLWVTAGLLLVSFVPPWVRWKARVARRVREESHRRAELVFATRRRVAEVDDGTDKVTNEELGARVDVVLAILEMEHLERLYRDLGRSEGQAILLRLLAPLSTVVLKVLRP